jgi:hypothetical protein
MHSADDAVGEIARLCGYQPLAIAMLASQLRHHPAWTAAGMAATLAAARDQLAAMHAEDLSVAAAFDLSYQDLTPAQQRLFRRLGLVPGPAADAYAAAALDGTSLDAARRHLDALYDQHLLTGPAPGRYVLHDLLRAHARALAAADDPAESDAATRRLLDYYLHTAQAADRHISSRPAPYRRGPENPPAYAPRPGHHRAGGGLAGSRTPQPARRRRPRRHARAHPARRPDSRRDTRLPARPRSPGPDGCPVPHLTGRGPAG